MMLVSTCLISFFGYAHRKSKTFQVLASDSLWLVRLPKFMVGRSGLTVFTVRGVRLILNCLLPGIYLFKGDAAMTAVGKV